MRSGRLTGTGRLVRAHLRVAWVSLTLWSALAAALVLATAHSIAALYPTLADRVVYAGSAGGSPGVAAFNGRGYDLTELGGIVGYEVGFMGLLAFPVIALHLAIRLSRHEEDSGRTELVTAGRVGRLAPLAAAAGVVGLCLTGFVLVVALGLPGAGLPVAGSWRYAISLGLYAAAFGAVGLLAAEVSSESRTAYGVSLFVVLATFLLRAVADGRGWDATWASPSGWLAEVRPWGAWQWWPLAAYLALIAACGLLSLAVAMRRDLAGGLLATRRGPARGRRSLGTPTGLAWRCSRAAFVGWLLGTAVWSAAFGALSGEMTDIVRANPSLLEALGVDKAEYVITSLALLLCGVGAAAFGVQAMSRLAREETSGRLGLVLSAHVTRRRVWLTWWALAVVGALVVLVVSALALGVVTAWATGDEDNVASSLGAGLALVTPTALITSVCALLHALAPRLAQLGWTLVGWATVVAMLAETLGLPEWARMVSPFYAAGQVPMQDPDTVALLSMTALLVVAMVVGTARFPRRDLAAG